MASLTTTQIALLAAATVVALLLFGPKIKDGLAAAWAKITGGDVAGGVQTLLDAIKNSDLVQKGAEIKGTAGNIASIRSTVAGRICSRPQRQSR